jgi:hypothetical protein
MTVLPKPDEDIIRKENSRPISHEHRSKSPQQNINKPNPTMYKKKHTKIN